MDANLVREAERLCKIFGVLDHDIKCLPRLVRRCDDKLLDFLELVNPEDAPGVSAVRANLLPKALGDAGVPARGSA